MPAFLLFAVTWAGLSPEQALERALDAAEPPGALRAAYGNDPHGAMAFMRLKID